MRSYRSSKRVPLVETRSQPEDWTASFRYAISPVSSRSRNVRSCTCCNTCTEFQTYHPRLAISARANAVATVTSRIGKALARPGLSAGAGVITVRLIYFTNYGPDYDRE